MAWLTEMEDTMAEAPAKSETTKSVAKTDPFGALHQEIERVFDRFSGGLGKSFFDIEPFRGGFVTTSAIAAPKVNVAETDKAFEVTAEIPGIDEKDIEVTLADGVLTIKGEKHEEKEEKDEKKNYHLVERSYGSFRRAFNVPDNVDEDKIKAEYDKGVLQLSLPKTKPSQPEQKARKISIASR